MQEQINSQQPRPTLGWREWLSLPDLKIDAIKAKVDTGARTSALHAYFVEEFKKDGEAYVRFSIHPMQKDSTSSVSCEAKIIDTRQIKDSGGHEEQRILIATPVRVGEVEWLVEMTLTNRETMGFRMLLGRTAIENRYYVDPGRSYLSRPEPLLSLTSE